MMSIIERARCELEAINFGEDDIRVMIEVMEKFFSQWNSGGAVSVAAPILARLIAGKPLTPLTGEDSEWMIHDFDNTGIYAQNIRCTSVMKTTKDGPAFDVDLGDASEKVTITFPYMPDVRYIENE
jgi:hypothetical protein